MGRYKAKAVIIREVNGIKIVFYNHENIYVQSSQGQWTVFHRWFPQKGSYNNGWRQFRHLLLYEKKITYNHCYRLAFRWEISSQANVREPDLSNINIEMRF